MGNGSRAIPRSRSGHRPPGGARRSRALWHNRHCARPRFQPSSTNQAAPWCVGAPLASPPGIASDRDTAKALAQKYRDPSAASRAFALAFTHAQSGLRHLDISNDEALLFERLASRALFADGSLRADPDTIAANRLGQSGLWQFGISGDLPILLVRVVGNDDVSLVRQVLQAQEYWRLKGLSADVVILKCRSPRRGSPPDHRRLRPRWPGGGRRASPRPPTDRACPSTSTRTPSAPPT